MFFENVFFFAESDLQLPNIDFFVVKFPLSLRISAYRPEIRTMTYIYIYILLYIDILTSGFNAYKNKNDFFISS